MKRLLSLTMIIALVLGSTAMCFGASRITSPEEAEYVYDTETYTWSEQIIPGELSLTGQIPNYLGTLKDVTLKTTQGTAVSDVSVVYLPDSKWDGDSYYSAVKITLNRAASIKLFSGSTPIIGWKDMYSYGFLPVDGGSVIFSGKNVQMHLLQGPGLYTGFAALPFTTENLGIDRYEEAEAAYPDSIQYFYTGKEFILVLDDTTISHFLSEGTLDTAARSEWPGLAELITENRKPVVTSEKRVGMENFASRNTYVSGLFTDVNESSASFNAIRSVYESGLMNGSGNRFNPDGEITLAECIKIAACMHDIYCGGDGNFPTGPVWYSTYVTYAINNDIITATNFAGDNGVVNYNRPASYVQAAYILGNALPASALESINDVKSIPDLRESSPQGRAIYRLCRAGVITDYENGLDLTGSMTRAEAAELIAKIVNVNLRTKK